MARRKKPERRAPGSGAPYRAKNGTWTARYPKREGGYHVRRGFHTRTDAEAWCNSLEQLRVDKHDVTSSLRSVSNTIDAWAQRAATEREWKAKTRADVEFKLGYPKAYIGTMSVGDVFPDHIDQMLNELSKDLAPTTIRQIRNYLFQVFDDARQRRHISYNPVLKPQRRKRLKQKPPTRLSIPQTATLLVAAESSFYALAWWFLACCGLRSGEVLGLRRSDIDLDDCVLHIRQESTDLRGKAFLDLPKNDKTRDVPFPKALRSLIQAHLDRLTLRAALGVKRGTWKEHGLVFPGKSGKPMSTTSLRHALKELTTIIALPPITTHMLRHTAGGLLKAASCPYDVLGAILGHTPPGVTGHYAPPPVSEMRPWIEKIYRELAREVQTLHRMQQG